MIRRFQRYLIKELLMQILIVMSVVLMIFVLVDYLSRLDDFISAGITGARAAEYVLLKVPEVVVLLTPVCTMLGSVLALGLMNRRNELVIMESSGIPVTRVLKGVVLLGAGISLSLMLLSETLAPWASYRAHLIRRIEIKKKDLKTTRGENIWRKSGDGSILHIALYHPDDQSVSGISFFSFDSNYHLSQRIDAAKGTYLNHGSWTLETVLEQRQGAGETLETFNHDTLVVDLDLEPEDFLHAVKSSDEMRLTELRRYIRRVEKEGYDAAGYKTDWFARLFFPLSSLLMGLIGAGISVRRKWAGRLPLTMTLGLVVTFMFWILHSLFVSMGHGGILPPVPAAAAGLVLFFPIAGWLWLTHGR